jgi:hypothetical protein
LLANAPSGAGSRLWKMIKPHGEVVEGKIGSMLLHHSDVYGTYASAGSRLTPSAIREESALARQHAVVAWRRRCPFVDKILNILFNEDDGYAAGAREMLHQKVAFNMHQVQLARCEPFTNCGKGP